MLSHSKLSKFWIKTYYMFKVWSNQKQINTLCSSRWQISFTERLQPQWGFQDLPWTHMRPKSFRHKNITKTKIQIRSHLCYNGDDSRCIIMLALSKFTFFGQLVSRIHNSFVWVWEESYNIRPFGKLTFNPSRGKVWDRFGTAAFLLWPSAKKFKNQDHAIADGV